MKYPNIKAAKISHAQIAKAFGYANVKSFRTSSAHQRHMKGVEEIIKMISPKIELDWENFVKRYEEINKELSDNEN